MLEQNSSNESRQIINSSYFIKEPLIVPQMLFKVLVKKFKNGS